MSWSRSLEPYRASWRKGSNPCCPDLNPSSPRSELNDLLPHLGRTEPAVILGASAIWQGGEGPGHEALLGRAAGQARGSAFERRHSTAICLVSFFPTKRKIRSRSAAGMRVSNPHNQRYACVRAPLRVGARLRRGVGYDRGNHAATKKPLCGCVSISWVRARGWRFALGCVCRPTGGG